VATAALVIIVASDISDINVASLSANKLAQETQRTVPGTLL
jgi:hypothetical protein